MKVPGLRWLTIGLIFLATVINYIDRQTLAVLKKTICDDLGLSDAQYGAILAAFLLAYATSMTISGKLYDAIGARRGFMISIVVWSLAAISHAAARGVASFGACRVLLGLGEAGNWPGAAKSIGEWFPIRERALAMGIFNTGAALGGALSPPLIAWLALRYGWRMTFLLTGLLGFVWLALWALAYRAPAEHPWLTPSEKRLILEGQSETLSGATSAEPRLSLRAILGHRQAWAIILARFVTDPIWWLYVGFLPTYFQEARGMDLRAVGATAWFPYLAGGVGALSGGWISGSLIQRGWSVDRARKAAMLLGAALTPAGILAVNADTPTAALNWMGLVLFGFQVWINNVQTLPSDFFPRSAIASVAGLGGTAAGLSSAAYVLGTGYVVGYFKEHGFANPYTPVFVLAGILGPLGALLLFAVGGRIRRLAIAGAAVLLLAPGVASAQEALPAFEELLAHPVQLKPELRGVHPRVFVTGAGLEKLRQRARTTHRAEWQRVLGGLVATKGAPPPVPGPQERRSQNNAAFAIAEASLAYAVDRKPEYLAAAKRWTLAAIDYEPWGYTYNKPNLDLAAGHLLYAIGWAYDLLYADWSPAERDRIRASLERHAGLVHDHFAAAPGKRFQFTQNHDFIPTAGLGIAALALLGESRDAPKWAALARAHQHRAGQLLSPDGHYYEGFEYWIFSSPWLVHFLDGWEHATGESLWNRDLFQNWKLYLAHALLPDGQNVFDFGDIWEGALTRARSGSEYPRVYPGGRLQSNFNVMYRVAARLRDPEAQAIAERYAAFGHSNLEEFWTLIWRDESLAAAPMSALPLTQHFADSGVFYHRTSWDKDALAFAFKAGPPEGHRTAVLLSRLPEWTLDSGHAHPDAGSFIVYAHGTYLTGDSGYAGLPSARNHNTLTFEGVGQGAAGNHDVWRGASYAALDAIRIRDVKREGDTLQIEADLRGAYPQVAGLRSLVRTLGFDGRGRFSVRDHLVLAAPSKVEWHLQSDTPFERGAGDRYRNGAAGAPALEVAFAGSVAGVTTTGPSKVKSPGPPGSIEKGPEEDRGFVLVRDALAPAGETQLAATLTIVAKRP